MHPVLIEIPLFGGIRIYTYGVLVALGFLAGIAWTIHEGKKKGIPKDLVLDLSFYIVLSALVGSRILYILFNWERYLTEPLAALKLWEGGLIFFGGLIGAVLASYLFLKKRGVPFLTAADLFAPGISLGHAIGRLGCLAAGCCHGREAPTFPLAITFQDLPYCLAPSGTALYPTQLMEAAASFLIFLSLAGLAKMQRFSGQIFWTYLFLYGIVRAGLEPFRAEAARNFSFGPLLSNSQWISIIISLTALILYFRQRKGEPL